MHLARTPRRALPRAKLPHKALCDSALRTSSIGIQPLSRTFPRACAAQDRILCAELGILCRKSAFFEDRGRGEKIQFDSQSIAEEDDQPVAGPSHTKHGRRSSSLSTEEASPERPRGYPQRSPSPLPSRRVLGDEDEDDEDEAATRPGPAFGGPRGAYTFEVDQYVDDFGGGFDEPRGSEMDGNAEGDSASRASDRLVSKARARTMPSTRATRTVQRSSSQVKRAMALAGGISATPMATGEKSSASRRSDRPASSSFDSSSSSDSDLSDGDLRRRLTSHSQRASPNRKRQRADRSILSDDDEPMISEARQSKRERHDVAPQRSGAGTGNIYYQARNHSGGRIAWSPAEVDELHKYLRAFGCDWKRMIFLSGPQGKKNQVFKDRTNVSLKDKAVNEKLALLRAGLPIPDYLQDGEWAALLAFLPGEDR